MKRRTWRILPPYYVALLMWPLYFLAVRGLKHLLLGEADYADVISMLDNGKLLANLFLVQNLRPEWGGEMNPVLWSVAIEFQIYILFILVLLPMWQRFGSWVTLAVSFTVS